MNYKNFRFRSWHFVVAILLFYALTGIISEIKMRQIPVSETKRPFLTEVDEIVFDEEDGISFIFFYRKDSELCGKMHYNIEQIAEKVPDHIHMYAIDVEKHPGYFYKYNVSGIPNILIFKGDKEIKRVMGVVSPKNLEKIMKQIEAR